MKTGSVYESLRKGCLFTAFPSAAQPALAGPLNTDAYRRPPPQKKKNNSGKLKFVDFCCSPQCVCVLLSLSLPLWIVDPGHISGLAVRTQRHYVSVRSRFDGRLSLRLLNRGRLCATLRDSSRNSLCGQLIGRSVALSGARCTHC